MTLAPSALAPSNRLSVASKEQRKRLFEILSFARPHGSETEIQFCHSFLDTVEGMTQDAFGNRMITIGPRPATVLWSCHVDTVAKRGGPQELAYSLSTGIVTLADGKPGMSLGADDGVGVWMMLEMIAAKRPGLYVFHRGEEVGCLGSRWIAQCTPELLDDIQAAIAFDRQGHRDVITYQASGRTCSDAFADSIALQLNRLDPAFAYRPDDTGIYTDTNEYAGIVPECTNLSVGYHGQHGPKESLDVLHALDLLKAMLTFDTSLLTISREAGEYDDYDYLQWREYDDKDFAPRVAVAPSSDASRYMLDLVMQHPSIAAQLLLDAGYDVDDMLDAAWSQDMDLDADRYGSY